MKIKYFIAKKVHDHFDFKMEFNDDLNFITGINGTGKTTVLKLMKAALLFELNTLISISYSILKIELEHDNNIYSVSISKKKGFLNIILNGRETTIEYPSFIDDEVDFISEKSEDFIDSLYYKHIINGDEIFKFFLKEIRPLFLGLDRQMDYLDDDEQFNYRPYHPRNRAIRKNYIDGLENCQKLIENAYRKYRRVSDGSLNRIINVIIESSFEYIDFNSSDVHRRNFDPRVELQKLKERQADLEAFTSKISISGHASQQITKFFTQMSSALSDHDGEAHMGIEWLMNLAQTKRIKDIISEIDRQKKSAEVYLSPIQDYIASVNKFFKHSKKELHVDQVGKLSIYTQGGQSINIKSLSSGEKQLLILLTHARLGNNKKRVFIVDEPELSLHLKWQEMLIEELIKDTKNKVQFICATHSPEIVGYHREKCINI